MSLLWYINKLNSADISLRRTKTFSYQAGSSDISFTIHDKTNCTVNQSTFRQSPAKYITTLVLVQNNAIIKLNLLSVFLTKLFHLRSNWRKLLLDYFLHRGKRRQQLVLFQLIQADHHSYTVLHKSRIIFTNKHY